MHDKSIREYKKKADREYEEKRIKKEIEEKFVVRSPEQLIQKLDSYFANIDLKLGVGMDQLSLSPAPEENLVYNIIEKYFQERDIRIYKKGSFPPEAKKKENGMRL